MGVLFSNNLVMQIVSRNFDKTVQDISKYIENGMIRNPHVEQETEQISDRVYIICLIFYDVNRFIRQESILWNK